jgi:hypothetical protein
MPFTKGRAKTGGRKIGVPNRSTTLLKIAIIGAGVLAGFPKMGTVEVSDPKNPKKKIKVRDLVATGKDGLQGYLLWLALHEPKAYAGLLGRVLPLQVAGEGRDPVRMIDETMSANEAAQLYAQALRDNAPAMIDITPEDIAHLPRNSRVGRRAPDDRRDL